MKKKTLPLIILSLLFSISIVIVLYLCSDKINHHSNDFIRLFPPHLISRNKILDLKYNSYYIAGASNNNIYLGNVTMPFNILVTDYSLSDTTYYKIKPGNNELRFKSSRIIIDSPYFFIMDGTIPVILKGNLKDWQAVSYINREIYFTEAVPISSGSFAIRTSSGRLRQYVLGKETIDSPYIKLTPKLLEKQIDGYFCTDGKLLHASHTEQIVYIYHYRNQFICMDTNMNLLYRGKTIDTNSIAKIKVTKIKSDNSITLSAPPLLVNRATSVNGNDLFINSNLRADNENKRLFSTSSVIDVYNLEDGTYRFSFYLYNYGGKKIQDFMVINNKLISIHDRYLIIYTIDPDYFRK